MIVLKPITEGEKVNNTEKLQFIKGVTNQTTKRELLDYVNAFNVIKNKQVELEIRRQAIIKNACEAHNINPVEFNQVVKAHKILF